MSVCYVKRSILKTKTHPLECVKENTKMKCMESGAMFKKTYMYLNHHLKRIHCQGTSQNTIVKLVEVISPVHDIQRNEEESGRERSSDDDIEQYDSGDLIGDVYDSLDEDSNCSGVTDRVGW